MPCVLSMPCVLPSPCCPPMSPCPRAASVSCGNSVPVASPSTPSPSSQTLLNASRLGLSFSPRTIPSLSYAATENNFLPSRPWWPLPRGHPPCGPRPADQQTQSAVSLSLGLFLRERGHSCPVSGTRPDTCTAYLLSLGTQSICSVLQAQLSTRAASHTRLGVPPRADRPFRNQ